MVWMVYGFFRRPKFTLVHTYRNKYRAIFKWVKNQYFFFLYLTFTIFFTKKFPKHGLLFFISYFFFLEYFSQLSFLFQAWDSSICVTYLFEMGCEITSPWQVLTYKQSYEIPTRRFQFDKLTWYKYRYFRCFLSSRVSCLFRRRFMGGNCSSW